MKKAVLLLAAIFVTGMCNAQAEVKSMDKEGMEIIIPERGGMQLKFNHDTHRILVSDSAQHRWTFIWPDGSEMEFNKDTQDFRTWSAVMDKFQSQEWTKLRIEGGYYSSPTGGAPRSYVYKPTK